MKPFNLFVYGTLMNPAVFRAVLGRRLVLHSSEADNVESFCARDAILDDYKKISPDNSYSYAVPDRYGRIAGYVIGPLPGESMAALLKFEGRNYKRNRVQVQTKTGQEKAYAFLGHIEHMEHAFGYQFADPLKQEILLDEKIDAAVLETERRHLNTDEKISHRAVRELSGRAIRDIVRRHFEAGGISDYTIRHSLTDAPLRDYTRIVDDPKARAVAPYYLTMVTRQVIFNEIEEAIRKNFRYELDRLGLSDNYYERTVSSLVALRLLNSRSELMHLLVGDCLNDLSFASSHLIDYVRWAVMAADVVYDAQMAKQEMEYVRGHMGRGFIPMGAELEFSDVGHLVIRDPQAETYTDPHFDGFLYFYDFALDVLTWKLGGHIDDHRDKVSTKPRRGFFEIALGSLSIEDNISKPITNDPWLLAQSIHEARRFYEIQPHSVHISFQLRSKRRPVRDRVPSLAVMKCLFALVGDPICNAAGTIQISRLVTDEIISDAPSMMFSDISRRHSSDYHDNELVRPDGATGKFVQQFKFPRLASNINYEPIIMALKGLQCKISLGAFLSRQQYESSPKHKKLFDALLEWGRAPTELSYEQVEEFLAPVYDGLMSEHRGKPAHGEAYIAWSINQLRARLTEFNELFAEKK